MKKVQPMMSRTFIFWYEEIIVDSANFQPSRFQFFFLRLGKAIQWHHQPCIPLLPKPYPTKWSVCFSLVWLLKHLQKYILLPCFGYGLWWSLFGSRSLHLPAKLFSVLVARFGVRKPILLLRWDLLFLLKWSFIAS